MFWYLIGFPVIAMIIIIVVALLLGKRDRKKEQEQREINKQNLMKTNPKQATYDFIQQHKIIYEYLLSDIEMSEGNIDILYLSKKGIFLLTILNNTGDISGDLNGEYWAEKVRDDYAVKNPYQEKEALLKVVSNITNENINLYNVILFPNAKSITIANNDNNVMKLADFFPTIKEYKDVYSDNDLMVIYNLIDNHINNRD